MATITFDTLKFTRRLKESRLPELQAEAIADAFRDAQSESDLVTRQLLPGYTSLTLLHPSEKKCHQTNTERDMPLIYIRQRGLR